MNTPLGFGAKPRPQDDRDYTIPLGTATPYPESFSSPVSTIYMQGTYGTCGAHAGAQLMNVLYGITSSPKFLWKMIKSFDGYGLEDGTDLRSIFKALQLYGICDLALLNNDAEQSIQAYSDISEVTQAMRDNASPRKILSYSFLNTPTFEQIKQAIYEHKAVILLVDCGDAWWVNGWADSAVNPLKVGNFVGHHFICATEYGFTLIDGANSWSIAWGKNGMFDFDSSYIPHVLEMGVATVNIVAPVAKYQFIRNLALWNWGSDVYKLQQILVAEGCGNFSPTGFFGAKTFEAVKAYQVKYNIQPVTGNVGPITKARLNSA